MSENIKWEHTAGTFLIECHYRKDKYSVNIIEVSGGWIIEAKRNDREILLKSKNMLLGECNQRLIWGRYMRLVEEKYIYTGKAYEEQHSISSPNYEAKCVEASHNSISAHCNTSLKEYALFADKEILATPEGFHVRHSSPNLLNCIANELTYFKENPRLYELLCRDYDVVSVGKGILGDEIKKYIENDLENISTDELCLIWEGFREKDIPKTIEEAFKGLSRAQKAVVEYLFQPTEFDDEESSFILAFLVAYGRCSPTQYAIALIGPAESEDGVIECGEEFMLAKERANSCYEYMQLSAKGLDILDY